ncbi:ras association domain family member 6 S homeolog isoform X2 [Xenopus laevis]|uniref:Ras association domain family member 6 S homeolog isoform X2 n=1 Tax=Xenopus laevis TaxID=8355 RepID=A0A8J0TQ24_XENLA|nr:ras association domain family member 6 S homeolog isoform X2 [Xenopus laevis]
MARQSPVQNSMAIIKETNYITRSQLESLLKTYNCYFKDQKNLHITYHQDEHGKIIISGLIEIFWGVQRPIRFQMQDEKFAFSEYIQLPEVIGSSITKSGMMRWGEFDDLYHISELEETPMSSDEDTESNNGLTYSYDSSTLRPKLKEDPPDSPSLYRTMSDAALVKKRVKPITPNRGNLHQHRFSINGHFYNYKVETSPSEFALYIIHATGEKKKLKNSDCPLWERLLQGPVGKIARMFLMDKEAEEINSDVAQYIKFSLPLLESFLTKLNEEEEREIQRTMDKFLKERGILLQYLKSKHVKLTETTV